MSKSKKVVATKAATLASTPIVQTMIDANAKASKPSGRKRTARFEIKFTVEVEIDEPIGPPDWEVSDAICDVEYAAVALVDSAPRRPFRRKNVKIVDTFGFDATFLEEVGNDD